MVKFAQATSNAAAPPTDPSPPQPLHHHHQHWQPLFATQPPQWMVTGPPPPPPPPPPSEQHHFVALPPPPFAGGGALGAAYASDPRVLRRRSDPTLDVRPGIALSSASGYPYGRQRGGDSKGIRAGSLECLQYVGHLVYDIMPRHAGDESDVSSEASSYSAVVAGYRRASQHNAATDSDGGASSSGVSSLGSTSAFAPVAPHAAAGAARPASGPQLRSANATPDIPEEDEAAAAATAGEGQAPKVLHPSGVISPDANQLNDRVIWYQGRNLLDLGWNLTQSPWPLRYANLPPASPQFFLENRSQYHRLGPQGQQEPSERPTRCGYCTFYIPPQK